MIILVFACAVGAAIHVNLPVGPDVENCWLILVPCIDGQHSISYEVFGSNPHSPATGVMVLLIIPWSSLMVLNVYKFYDVS